ncbi:glutamate--tRNA ligase [Patescibacteria group bacterium]|nr:glutamate--tRNA ligase [Patescibacteria group bacterium]
MSPRVRFAPSPTGFFSLGNARTALFNWLFAKHEGGKFLLRIEDTDKERSKKEYEESILEGLKWLGLDWDEKVERQSERIPIYEKYLKRLMDEGRAYFCFCSGEELESERQAQLSQGLQPKYGGRCRNISKEEAFKRAEKENHVIRFKMPSHTVSFSDLIRGKVSFDLDLIGDIIIAKGFDSPLYNFAVVVDDEEMKITHVIRGEDHISNTPKQIAIQEALGFSMPIYAHLPLILGPDRKKLSKRYMDASLKDFKDRGYLPEAFFNFMLLLGWHPSVDKEVVSAEEAINDFSFKKVQKGGAVFNQEKLEWLNAYYLRNLPVERLAEELSGFVPGEWLEDEDKFKKIVQIERERLRHLTDFRDTADFFFVLKEYPADLLIWKGSSKSVMVDNLSFLSNVIRGIPNHELWSRENIDKYIMSVADQKGRGEVLWPLRVALSGKEASPGPSDILYVLGKEESLKRVEKALKRLASEN